MFKNFHNSLNSIRTCLCWWSNTSTFWRFGNSGEDPVGQGQTGEVHHHHHHHHHEYF